MSDPHGAPGTDEYDDRGDLFGGERRDDDYAPSRDYAPAGGRRRAKRRGFSSCLVFIVVFALVMVGGYYGLTKGIRAIQDQFSEAADYPGPGTGQIAFEVKDGDTATVIARELKAQDVVASVDAFVTAANANPDSGSIQAGSYQLMKQMKAVDALNVLVDPDNVVTTTVTVPEGLRVTDIVAILADKTDFGVNKFKQALKDPAALGLPDYADGDPEGYLFPATYQFQPDAQPADMLKAMVDRWRQSATSTDLEAKAAALGYSPQELMTVASMVQAEGRGDDMNKVARVIYNRLEIEPNPSAGFLQIDATVNYALDKPTIARLTTDEIDSVSDSPYNTYRQKGLPPTPIEAPGDDAINAALNPAEGPWFFYVTVNLATGETKFTDSPTEFLTFKNELDDYCANESKRC